MIISPHYVGLCSTYRNIIENFNNNVIKFNGLSHAFNSERQLKTLHVNSFQLM